MFYLFGHFVTEKCKFGFPVGMFWGEILTLGQKMVILMVFASVIHIKNRVIGMSLTFYVSLIHWKLKLCTKVHI